LKNLLRTPEVVYNTYSCGDFVEKLKQPQPLIPSTAKRHSKIADFAAATESFAKLSTTAALASAVRRVFKMIVYTAGAL